jgi:hypothetical protein
MFVTLIFLQLMLHLRPHILDGVQIWRIAGQAIRLMWGLSSNNFFHNLCVVAGCSITQKVSCVMLVHEKLQLVLHDLAVSDAIHYFTFLQELLAPSLSLHLQQPQAITLGGGGCLTVFLVNFMEILSKFLGLLHRLCGRVMLRLSDMFGEKRL